MDGLMLHQLIQEWQSFIGYKIEKVHQPAERDLVVTIRGRTGTSRILLSAHRKFFRVHQLTQSRPTNPQEPPMFCMLARKHLEGGRIAKIAQQDRDRVIEIYVDSYNELGDAVQYVLIVELMGKHSNIILCSTDEEKNPAKVLDSIVRVHRDMSSVRPILPGVAYVRPPAQNKVPIPQLTTTDLEQVDWTASHVKIAKKLPVYVAGIGPVTAQEALTQALECAESDPSALVSQFITALQTVYRDVMQGKTHPVLGMDAVGRPIAAAPFELHFCAQSESFHTYDRALEEFHREVAIRNQTGALHAELTQQVEQALDRLRAKRAKLEQELTKGIGHEQDRIVGEILTAYAFQVEKGRQEVMLPNFYADNELMSIQLDPAKTAIQNAQSYFKRASKRKRALTLLGNELDSVNQDIDYLDSCLLIVQDANAAEMEALHAELVQQGFLKAKRKKAKKTPAVKASPSLTQFTSSDGFPIFVGKNNTQNDSLTFRKSQPDDVWFHVKDQPGSHVVVRTSGKEMPVGTVEEAATVAAYFSKGRDSSNVAVDYTQIRHVWKPNGARPGFALYKEQKTLFVTPNRTIVKRLEQGVSND